MNSYTITKSEARSFFFQGGYEYNALPSEIIYEKKTYKFQAKIRKFYNQQN